MVMVCSLPYTLVVVNIETLFMDCSSLLDLIGDETLVKDKVNKHIKSTNTTYFKAFDRDSFSKGICDNLISASSINTFAILLLHWRIMTTF